MHVAMVTPLPADPGRPSGGVAVGSAVLIRSMVRCGVKVTAIAWGSTRSEPWFDERLECPVIPLSLRHPAFLMNWLVTPGVLKRLVDDVKPDIVHVQDVPEIGGALTCPRVFTMRGYNPRDEWLLGGTRRYVTAPVMALTFWWYKRKYKHVIMISPYSRRVGGWARDACLYDIPNPIEDGFFSVHNERFSPTVLVVGVLSNLKNTLAVVQAAAALRLRFPDMRIRIVGPWRENNPDYRRRVEDLWRKERLQETVHFIGQLTRDQIMAELSRAACLFLPSFQENAPMVIAEAMAAGVPVVASRVGGIPWMVEDGKTGYLFDPHRLDEMVDRLKRLLMDGDLCRQMGQNARQVAEGRFRAEVVAQKTLKVYETALASRG